MLLVPLAVWTLLLADTTAADVLDFTADSLPVESLGQYNVDISQSSVSGLSAGAYMADQFFVAFSKDMLGVGIFAGGPYGCADGSLSSAMGRCMNPAVYDEIDHAVIQQLYDKAVDYASQGKIDTVDYIEGKKSLHLQRHAGYHGKARGHRLGGRLVPTGWRPFREHRL
jgi:hypothetical protein